MADKSSQGMADKSSEAMNVRFMINTRTQRIVYAEAGGNYYVCSYLIGRGHSVMSTTHNISTSNTDICICGKPINHLVQLRQNTNTSGSSSQTSGQVQGNSGYVKEMLTFIKTDDLKIKGSSTITTITLLNQLSIKDLTDLEERTAIVDRNKVRF
ncbi:hypothetical protein SUGI_0132010 [Cryptomeria japonica]|nr:hypothetical protein SUGI_0132010 [Cryptomeria japonica]